MNRTDMESTYRILLGREINADEQARISTEYLTSIKDLPLDQYVTQTMASTEFLTRWKHHLLASLIPERLVVAKRLFNGLEMLIDLRQVYIGWGIATGCYESDEVEFVRGYLKPGFGFLDVGANIGFYTMIAAPIVGRQGFVHAFEPTTTSFNLLRESVERNALLDIVTLHQSAVSASPGMLVMTHDENSVNMGGAHIETDRTTTKSSPFVREEVPCVTLNDLDLDRRVNLIKIDVEGAEMFVLNGASKLIERDRPAVMIELNESQLQRVSRCTSVDIVRFFTQRGYRAYAMRARGQLSPIERPELVIPELQGSKGNTNVVMMAGE